MDSGRIDVLGDFLENFKDEIDFKIKTNNSNEEQLLEISSVLIEYLKYQDSFVLCDPKVVNSTFGTAVYLEIKTPVDSFQIIEGIEESLDGLGISFKRHNFKGSLPLFSAKNNTVPGVIYGRGNFLVTLQTQSHKNSHLLKIECLTENQLIKVLDGNISNLTIVFWNGKGMSRSIFILPQEKIEKSLDEENLFSLNLISAHPKNPYRITGQFYKSLNDSIVLDKITSIERSLI
jgi:hypothetical protein